MLLYSLVFKAAPVSSLAGRAALDIYATIIVPRLAAFRYLYTSSCIRLWPGRCICFVVKELSCCMGNTVHKGQKIMRARLLPNVFQVQIACLYASFVLA